LSKRPAHFTGKQSPSKREEGTIAKVFTTGKKTEIYGDEFGKGDVSWGALKHGMMVQQRLQRVQHRTRITLN